MDTLFDYAESKRLRDEGMSRTLDRSGDWKDLAMQVIKNLPVGFEGIGEDYRRHVSIRCGKPSSPNCWGALIMSAIKQGLLKGTGRLKPMSDAKSHARKSEVMVRV